MGNKIEDIKLLSEVLPKARERNAALEKSRIETGSFFLGKVYPGQLYSIVGPTNSGKTWWSLGTAISLAREGHKVGYITTEDTTDELVGHLDNLDLDDEALSRIELIYVEDIDEQGIRNLFEELHNARGCSIVVVDYLRPDILQSHHGDLNLTMGRLFKVMRGVLEKLPITIIQTLQANATLYQKDLGSVLENNPQSLFTMIEGGYTASKRSQVVGIIVTHEGRKGILLLKAKSSATPFIGQVFPYGEVDGSDFDISYQNSIDYKTFVSSNTSRGMIGTEF